MRTYETVNVLFDKKATNSFNMPYGRNQLIVHKILELSKWKTCTSAN